MDLRSARLLLPAVLFCASSVAFGYLTHNKNKRPNPSSGLRFSVGVIADIQYAPIPDGTSHAGVPRYYRNALVGARRAAQHFQESQVHLVLNLGDTIDGKCQMIAQEGGDEIENPGETCLQHVLDALSPYQHGPTIHTYGNHELYNLNREQIGSMLAIPFVQEEGSDELVGYQSHSYRGIRFVVLDSMDVSCLRPEGTRKKKLAEAILRRENPNFPHLENSPEGLEDVQKRFVAFNGGVDEPQLQWLRRTLQEARESSEKVVLLSHQPILPDSCSPVTLIWNYEDVLVLLREFADVVVLSLAGHAHKGGYKRDEVSGIHFRVIEAVLETPAPGATYAIMEVHEGKIELIGYGDCTSATYDFDHCMVAAASVATPASKL
jgi:manganese-dependent ADP-ribose/CDP-alcohol diphosphatase